MSNITKAVDKTDRIIESIDYRYVRIEIESRNQHYIEKDKHTTIGFKAGDNVE